MSRVRLALACSLLAGFLLLSPRTNAQSNIYFRSSFDNAGTDNRYDFEYRWPNSNYHVVHLPNGGDQGAGDGAANVRIHPGANDYNLGWIVSPLGRTFNTGDSLYIRFRIRFDDDYSGWVERQGKNKFILIGTTGTTPNSRIIVYMHPPHDQFGCTLGQVDWMTAGNPLFAWAQPAYFGLTGSWFTAPLAGNYGSIGPYVNIDWIGNCAPPALVTRATTANAPAPGPNSARPVNGWYHFQIQATSGAPGAGAFRVWVNNNTYATPTSQQIGLRNGLGKEGWGNSQLYVGGYQDGISTGELGYRIDDFELAGSYDPAWYPGGGGPPSPSAPGAPSGVRIISN